MKNKTRGFRRTGIPTKYDPEDILKQINKLNMNEKLQVYQALHRKLEIQKKSLYEIQYFRRGRAR